MNTRMAICGNVGVVIIFCFSLIECSAEDVPSSLKARLFGEGSQALKRLQEQAKHTRCLISQTRSEYDKDNKVRGNPSQSQWELEFNGDWFLFKQRTSRNTGVAVWARNSKYGFSCGNRSENDKMTLSYRGPASSTELADDSAAFGSVVRNSFSLFDVPLATIITDPSFKISRLTSSKVNEHELVEMEFTLNSTGNVSGIQKVKSGRVILDPHLQWVIKEYDIELKRDATEANQPAIHAVASIKYNETDPKVPTISEVVYKLVRPNRASSLIIWKHQIKEIGPANSPEDAFKLTAFGLPEIEEGPKPAYRTASFWVALIALVCVTLAFVMRRIAKRS